MQHLRVAGAARCFSSRAYTTAAARVTKFGGTSVAGASQIQEVMGLLRADIRVRRR